MTYEESQTKSQPVQQNNDPDRTQEILTDDDIETLIGFFSLLDEWEREIRSGGVEEPSTSEQL